MYQVKPILNELVEMKLADNAICFSMPNDEFSVEFDDKEVLSSAYSFLNNLPTSLNNRTYSERDVNNFRQLIEMLDSQSVLTCYNNNKPGYKTGVQFICELEFFYRKLILQREGVDDVTKLIKSKKISEEQLVRWLDQYKLVTSLAESVLASTLSNSNMTGGLYASLLHFYKEEIGHDKLINPTSNESEQYDGVHISFLAIMSLMKQHAKFDIYSFIAYVLILEGSSGDSSDFIDLLSNSNLPKELIDGHIKHEKINISAGHENEAREISLYLADISNDDFERVKRSVRNHYDIRMYANDFILNDKYHGDISQSEIIIVLRRNIKMLMRHSMGEAISNSSGKLKLSLTRIFLNNLNSDKCECEKRFNIVLNIYKESLWLLANVKPSDYYSLISFFISNDESILSGIESQIGKVIVRSIGFYE
ncbi:hypothetical protein L5164_003781 [Vibrio parahaemolyticus]|nr:hypothetical protein [Vibrio parahaemolyticus]